MKQNKVVPTSHTQCELNSADLHHKKTDDIVTVCKQQHTYSCACYQPVKDIVQ